MTINDAGLELIKQYEGFRSKPYTDLSGHVTIGYGTTLYLDGTPVTLQDQPMDELTASTLLENLLNNEYCAQVQSVIKVQVNSNQFSALVSFTYNMGIGSLKESTALRCLNALNYDDCANALLLWNKTKVAGVMTPESGLTRRRQAERNLFLTP